MKATQLLLACAAVLAASVSAQAQTVVHITGSSAFRDSTVTAIQKLMGDTGNFKAAYQTSSGAGTTASAQCVIQGTISGLPAGANPVTVKCLWTGSVGGIQTLVQNRDVTNWMSISNLPSTNTTVGIAAPTVISYSLDTATFPTESPKADVILADNQQASTGFNTTTLVQRQVGIVPFEWVLNSGDPLPIQTVTPQLAQAALSGGAPQSTFTGIAGNEAPIYVLGRNFDSGTRLSCLAETGVGVFGNVIHVQAVAATGPNPGAQGSSIAQLRYYPAETVLDRPFAAGNSGYSSGGTVADLLATPGSSTAETEGSIPPSDRLLFGPGRLIAYVGRTDAVRATRTTQIATNTAKRLKWNGMQIWNDPVAASGVPASYNDNLITEGLYNLWEYEYLSYRSGLETNRKAVADSVALQIINVDATRSGLKLNTMHVSKQIEGGLITYGVTGQ